MPGKRKLSQVSLIFACGTALFADGYANGVIGNVNTLLTRIYGEELSKHNYSRTVTSLAFAGTVLGMITFGYLMDRIGRKTGMMAASCIVAFFSALSAASFGANHKVGEMLSMLSACRFLLGIGIGAEYPCGCVAASEQSEGSGVAKKSQHRWVALSTGTMINFGFVSSAFVPLVLFWIFGNDHLRAVWRLSLGLGAVPALGVLIWRFRMEEPMHYRRYAITSTSIPYGIVFRRYWKEWVGIAFTWFIWDFIIYPFGLFSSTVINNITGGNQSLNVVFGWNVVIYLLYLPGSILGAPLLDIIGPKNTLIVGLVGQSVVGFIIGGLYEPLTKHIAAFAVMYGVFLSCGQVGPGNCTLVLSAKTGPTAIRGTFYGFAAAAGKAGAFVGIWAFPPIIDAFGGAETARGNTGPFWVGSGLSLLSAIVAFLLVRPLQHDGMLEEDEKFRQFLSDHGYDVSRMGLAGDSEELASVTQDEKDSSLDVVVQPEVP